MVAVEELVADNKTLYQRVQRARDHTRRPKGQHDEAFSEAVAKRLIANHANRSAVSGGITALPALFPGAGTVITVLGGALADMALVLKFEVELALCLSHVYGFDIGRPQERQFAYLLAAVSTFEAKGGNLKAELEKAEAGTLFTYSSREAGKLLLAVLSKLAVLSVSKGLSRAVPFVGVVIGGSVNKVLTTRVGNRCQGALAERQRRERQKRPVVEVKAADT